MLEGWPWELDAGPANSACLTFPRMSKSSKVTGVLTNLDSQAMTRYRYVAFRRVSMVEGTQRFTPPTIAVVGNKFIAA